MNQSRILVFAGSTRTDSLHRKLARQKVGAFEAAGAKATYIELRDFPMPIYDGDTEAANGLPDTVKRFKALLREHDGIAIASPEYNGSFPALVKNLVDWVTRPEPGESHSAAFRGKPVALLSASPGPGGGQRGLRHLRELFEAIGARVIPEQVTVAKAFHAFNEDGALTRPEDVDGVRSVATQLAQAA